jgi:hypothetical protein
VFSVLRRAQVVPPPRQHLSLRIERATPERLNRRARHTGQPRSTVAERYVLEGIRMDEQPDIRFVDGSLGRRSAVIGTGLDVWEIIETVRSNDDSVAEAAAYLEIKPDLIAVAVGYYGSNREEIDGFIERVREIADDEEARWLRARDALA